MNVNVCEGVEWVGCVDWSVRDFHGYQTDRGTSYNAYLVRDEKTVKVGGEAGLWMHEHSVFDKLARIARAERRPTFSLRPEDACTAMRWLDCCTRQMSREIPLCYYHTTKSVKVG